MYLIRSSPHSLTLSSQICMPTNPVKYSCQGHRLLALKGKWCSWLPSSWNTFCPWLVRHTFKMLFIWLAAFSRSPFTVSFFSRKSGWSGLLLSSFSTYSVVDLIQSSDTMYFLLAWSLFWVPDFFTELPTRYGHLDA